MRSRIGDNLISQRTLRLLQYGTGNWIGTLRLFWFTLFCAVGPLYSQTPDSFNPSISGTPLGLAIQADSRIFVIGSFTSIAGQARLNNSRLNSDGSFDFSYFAGGTTYPIRAVAFATNGDIYLGGDFVLYGGVDRPYLIRVTGSGGVGIFGTWPNGPTRALAIQPDGKLIAGGDFTSIGGVGRYRIARLNADNSVDTSFNPAADSTVYSLALQPDGKILVGGAFTSIAGASRTNLVRLNPDGTLDLTFSAATLGVPKVLLVQPDGKIVIGGDSFTTPLGVSYCCRLNADGSFDTNFNPVLAGSTSLGVNALSLQTDGKIIVGGTFDSIGGIICSNLSRLFPDGSIDTNFMPVVDPVYSLALQPDGRLLFGSSGKLGRLLNTEPAIRTLSFDNSSATWTRSGTAPEAWFATFEITTNGIDWVPQGNPSRIEGGWEATELSVPPAPVLLRARGYIAGGNWFDEQLAGWPLITGQPPGSARGAGMSVTFGASVIGPGLTYQWLKNGTNFNPDNGGGAQSPSLTLTNVLAADAGQYQLVVSNSWGSVTSQVSTLKVIDPYLGTQPVSVITNAGVAVNFVVGATGTPPLSYQWFKAGTPLPQANAPNLTFTNVQPADAANYFVIITNQYGSCTSSVVSLTVNAAIPDYFAPTSNIVDAMAVQKDGRILLGSPISQLCNPIQYNSDGSLDSSFTAGVSNNTVSCMLIQTDGKILVSGTSTDYTNYLWRLNTDGSVDDDFTITAPPFSASVNCLAEQPGGKILVGGHFTVGTQTIRANLARLNPDGSLDTNFVASANNTVSSLALQPDGAIIVGGGFTTLNGANRAGIGRFQSDGSLDASFNPNLSPGVLSLLVQPDGKILAAGPGLMFRLNRDGSKDTSFHAFTGEVFSLGLQSNGKIVVGGFFNELYVGFARRYFARLYADGTIDPYVFPSVNGSVDSIALQSDGAILVGGNFTTVNGLVRTNIARIVNPDIASQNLSFQGSAITWQRAGSSPAISEATFEFSADGTNWMAATAGSPVPGGWQLTGPFSAGKTFVRARGPAAGGYYDGSGWFVEAVSEILVPPRILVNDPSFGFNSNQFGFNINAASGDTIVVEASTDLQTWTTLSTNLVSNTNFYFSEPVSMPLSQRFYRLRLQ